MSPKTNINGIDVVRQREASSPSTDPAGISTSTEWLGGTQTRTLVATARGRGSRQEFAIDSDYPDALLGSGTAPSPDELLLAALSSSFVASFVLAAAAADVRIEFMRVRATRAAAARSGDRGGISSGDLELKGEVETEASPAHLEQLAAIAVKRSPVMALCRLNIRAVLGRASRRAV